MIIEFVGCTGAGKTTLISRVQRELAKVTDVSSSFQAVAASLGLQSVTHPTAQNLIQETVVFPIFIKSLYRHRNFLLYAIKMLMRQRTFSFFTTSYLRSLERAIGVYELTRRHQRNSIVLVDEGTVLLAHNLFVYTNASYTLADITKFADLAPLPDLIVYIWAPINSLIERALARNDPPREMRSQNPLLIEQYVRRAVAMFDQLAQAPQIQNRILILRNENRTDQEVDIMAGEVAAHILNRYASGQSRGHFEPVASTSTNG